MIVFHQNAAQKNGSLFRTEFSRQRLSGPSLLSASAAPSVSGRRERFRLLGPRVQHKEARVPGSKRIVRPCFARRRLR